MGLARRNHGGELRRAPFRCRRPTDPLLPAGRVHLSIACAQPCRERPTAHSRRQRPLPCAARADRDGARLARHQRSGHRVPADPGHSRSALLTRGGSGLPALPSARSRPVARPRRRSPRLSQCPTASTPRRCSRTRWRIRSCCRRSTPEFASSRNRRCAHNSRSQSSVRSESLRASST